MLRGFSKVRLPTPFPEFPEGTLASPCHSQGRQRADSAVGPNGPWLSTHIPGDVVMVGTLPGAGAVRVDGETV